VADPQLGNDARDGGGQVGRSRETCLLEAAVYLYVDASGVVVDINIDRNLSSVYIYIDAIDVYVYV